MIKGPHICDTSSLLSPAQHEPVFEEGEMWKEQRKERYKREVFFFFLIGEAQRVSLRKSELNTCPKIFHSFGEPHFLPTSFKGRRRDLCLLTHHCPCQEVLREVMAHPERRQAKHWPVVLGACATWGSGLARHRPHQTLCQHNITLL